MQNLLIGFFIGFIVALWIAPVLIELEVLKDEIFKKEKLSENESREDYEWFGH